MKSAKKRQAEHVPSSLRLWFIIHFWVDLLFALPLLFAPGQTLAFFGISGDAILARLIGAALIGIGGTSLLERNASRDTYSALLTLKLLWSGTATFALLFGAATTTLWSLWLFTAVFFGFFCVWAYFKKTVS